MCLWLARFHIKLDLQHGRLVIGVNNATDAAMTVGAQAFRIAASDAASDITGTLEEPSKARLAEVDEGAPAATGNATPSPPREGRATPSPAEGEDGQDSEAEIG
mmetsp:Transcript_7890/g.14384  ORF Transcript_7890/g.14384 Transcript_7890/m.14384 type:complete len:104 (-) Transcript_7890:79-390(-)